jgi:hypothetical protein
MSDTEQNAKKVSTTPRDNKVLEFDGRERKGAGVYEKKTERDLLERIIRGPSR